jgi:hypothetical protein
LELGTFIKLKEITTFTGGLPVDKYKLNISIKAGDNKVLINCKCCETFFEPQMISVLFYKVYHRIMITKYEVRFNRDFQLTENELENIMADTFCIIKIIKITNDIGILDGMRDFPSDIKFLIENQYISAHKFVLAQKSEVFKTMFMTESNKVDIIEIKDVPFETFDIFIKLFYIDIFKDISKITFADLKKLLELIKKYKIHMFAINEQIIIDIIYCRCSWPIIQKYAEELDCAELKHIIILLKEKGVIK